jgi:hypothetical protein
MMVSLAQAWQVVCQDPEAAKVTPKEPPAGVSAVPVRTL